MIRCFAPAVKSLLGAVALRFTLGKSEKGGDLTDI